MPKVKVEEHSSMGGTEDGVGEVKVKIENLKVCDNLVQMLSPPIICVPGRRRRVG